MIFGFLGALFVVLFVVWRRWRAANGPAGPLGGYDTGVRSPYRSPARLFHNRRSL